MPRKLIKKTVVTVWLDDDGGDETEPASESDEQRQLGQMPELLGDDADDADDLDVDEYEYEYEDAVADGAEDDFQDEGEQ